MKRTWLSIGIVVLLLSIYPGIYLYSLSTVDAENVELSAITLGTEGITFSGSLDLINPGFVEVQIDQLEYQVLFEPTGQVLGTGSIAGVVISAGGSAPTLFSNTVQYPELSLQLLQEKELNFVIDGTATATFLRIPFTKSFQITFNAAAHHSSMMSGV